MFVTIILLMLIIIPLYGSESSATFPLLQSYQESTGQDATTDCLIGKEIAEGVIITDELLRDAKNYLSLLKNNQQNKADLINPNDKTFLVIDYLGGNIKDHLLHDPVRLHAWRKDKTKKTLVSSMIISCSDLHPSALEYHNRSLMLHDKQLDDLHGLKKLINPLRFFFLKHIDLSYNKLVKSHLSLFNSCYFLESIKLDHNHIDKITKKNLEGLPSTLVLVDLSYNHLSTLPSFDINDREKLTINLKNNRFFRTEELKIILQQATNKINADSIKKKQLKGVLKSLLSTIPLGIALYFLVAACTNQGEIAFYFNTFIANSLCYFPYHGCPNAPIFDLAPKIIMDHVNQIYNNPSPTLFNSMIERLNILRFHLEKQINCTISDTITPIDQNSFGRFCNEIRFTINQDSSFVIVNEATTKLKSDSILDRPKFLHNCPKNLTACNYENALANFNQSDPLFFKYTLGCLNHHNVAATILTSLTIMTTIFCLGTCYLIIFRSNHRRPTIAINYKEED
jgi:hypothetical protein